jgi:hypothetical protein
MSVSIHAAFSASQGRTAACVMSTDTKVSIDTIVQCFAFTLSGSMATVQLIRTDRICRTDLDSLLWANQTKEIQSV